jgi:hypothetical protein
VDARYNTPKGCIPNEGFSTDPFAKPAGAVNNKIFNDVFFTTYSFFCALVYKITVIMIIISEKL